MNYKIVYEESGWRSPKVWESGLSKKQALEVVERWISKAVNDDHNWYSRDDVKDFIASGEDKLIERGERLQLLLDRAGVEQALIDSDLNEIVFIVGQESASYDSKMIWVERE